MKKSDYVKDDIIEALSKVGLKKGDNVFNHSNIGFFGILENADNMIDYCNTFKNSIMEIIGEDEGTLVVPTFTYSYCWNKVYDKKLTKGTCGIFSEFIRNMSNSFRSDDGNFSVSAIGKNAEFFTKEMPENPFAENSFWDRFSKVNGKICNFNF